jgi:putative ABC transport system substrate-binding protein
MDRRGFVVLIGGALAAPLAVRAQAPGRLRRIAILDDASEQAQRQNWRSFLKRLGELGYVEGKNLVVDTRFARGPSEQLRPLAAELLAREPEIIVTRGTAATLAVMQATSNVPIVFVGVADPVGSGVAASLGRPGGNATGLSPMQMEFGAKWIELLREFSPTARRLAFLADSSSKGSLAVWERLRERGRPMNIAIQVLDGRQRVELERSFNTIVRERLDGLIVGATAVLIEHCEQIVRFAAEQKLPAVYARREYVDKGGLLSYGADYSLMFVRAVDYVHRIAQGAKPLELPVEQPTIIRMVVNRKAARALDIRIPQSILLRADEVIE